MRSAARERAERSRGGPAAQPEAARPRGGSDSGRAPLVGTDGTAARTASSPGPGALPGPRVPERCAEREQRSGGRGARPPHFGGRCGGTAMRRREREAGRRRAPQPAARIAASRGARGAQSAPERSGSGAQLRNPPTPPRSASGAAPRTRVGRGGLSTARSEVCGGGEEESGRRSRGSTGALGQPFQSGESPGDPPRAAPRRGDRAARERGERGSAELSPGARGALPAARGTRPRGSRRHRGGHGHRDSPRTAGRAHSPGKHTTSWSTELVIFKKKIHQHGCSSLRMSKAAHRKRGEGLKQLTHTEIKRNKGEKKKKKGGG